jgi:hypothetical protein
MTTDLIDLLVLNVSSKPRVFISPVPEIVMTFVTSSNDHVAVGPAAPDVTVAEESSAGMTIANPAVINASTASVARRGLERSFI